MNNPTNKTADFLAMIEEGMTVQDADGADVGKVAYVQFGDEDLATPEPETTTAQSPVERKDSLVDNLAEAFTDMPQIPGEMVARLEREGFLRVNAGLFQRDYFILPGQITGVDTDDEIVRLSVTHDGLLKR